MLQIYFFKIPCLEPYFPSDKNPVSNPDEILKG